LITGEERRIHEDASSDGMSSCTVEMVPLNTKVDVAVIDEIQMIGNTERGWAWTQAFLGVMADEVHLCGELRTIPLIEDLCATMGDELTIHRYDRLSPLQSMKTSLRGDLSKLEKGDCIVSFSRVGIHAMKNDVEKATGKRCAIVYGSLPPETRAQQANLFNDPNNDYDFLVASDAIGMGLNLSIKRVIFEATSKHDGKSFRTMEISELKQIGGRAGRYKTAAQTNEANSPVNQITGTSALRQLQAPPAKSEKTVGLVTTLQDFDLPVLKKAMSEEAAPLETAGVFPPAFILTRFAAYFPPKTPFSYIIMRVHELSKVHPRFRVCELKERIGIADIIQPYKLTVPDRLCFLAAPVALRDPLFVPALKAFAKCVADDSGGELLDIKEVNLELLDTPLADPKEQLNALESLHKVLTLYLWLSYRFAGVFRSQALAFHVKALVEKQIDDSLATVEVTKQGKLYLDYMRRKATERALAEAKRQGSSGEERNDVEEQVQDMEVALPLKWDEGGSEQSLLQVLEEDSADPTPVMHEN